MVTVISGRLSWGSGMTARDDFLALWKAPSQRDVQVRVGPSDLSDPCGYCLGRAMLRTEPSTQGRYWLAARLGTAIHAEHATLVKPPDLPEHRVHVGDIEGYGEVYGASDWVSGTEVRDLKTTERAKLAMYRIAESEPPDQHELSKVTEARYTLSRYFNQCMLYGLGCENEGHAIETVAIVFVCRDGKTDDDVWSTSRPYDRDVALTLLDRASKLWAYLQGNDVETLASNEHCWVCNREGRT